MSESKAITVLYFASLGEALGLTKETLTLPCTPCTINQLKEFLSGRGEQWKIRLEHSNTLCAVNQELCQNPDHAVEPDDEIAFFPPVTGG